MKNLLNIMRLLHQRVERLELDAGALQDQKCAYVTLVMRGDFYVPGAIVMAHSLRKAGTKHELVAMVTDDVSFPARTALECVFDKVVDVAYIRVKHAPLSTSKMETMYHSWMDDSLTLFRCLGLTDYDKVCVLDSDIVILRNLDDVFALSSPCGCFHSFWLSNQPKHDVYMHYVQQGNKIPNEIVETALKKQGAFVCIGNCLLLKPSTEAVQEFDKYIADSMMRRGYVGYKGIMSAPNEQVIADFYARWMRQEWTQMSTQYQCVPWKHKPREGPPYLFHYFHLKPWAEDVSEYPDLAVWWAAGAEACRKYPELDPWVFKGRRGEIMRASGTIWKSGCCTWCKGNHDFIDFEHNQILCPGILKASLGD